MKNIGYYLFLECISGVLVSKFRYPHKTNLKNSLLISEIRCIREVLLFHYKYLIEFAEETICV